MIEFNGTITCKAAIVFEKLWFKSVSFALIVTFVIFECLPIYLAIAVSIDYLIYVVCIAIVFLLAFLVLISKKKE